MKIEMTITRAEWAYRLRIANATSGHLYAHLVGKDGVKVGAILTMHRGPRYDAAVADAPAIYAELLSKFPAASARDNSQITKPTTTAKKAEPKTSPAAPAARLSGSPARQSPA